MASKAWARGAIFLPMNATTADLVAAHKHFHGLSQAETAKRCGIPMSTVVRHWKADWRPGKTLIRPGLLKLRIPVKAKLLLAAIEFVGKRNGLGRTWASIRYLGSRVGLAYDIARYLWKRYVRQYCHTFQIRRGQKVSLLKRPRVNQGRRNYPPETDSFSTCEPHKQRDTAERTSPPLNNLPSGGRGVARDMGGYKVYVRLDRSPETRRMARDAVLCGLMAEYWGQNCGT